MKKLAVLFVLMAAAAASATDSLQAVVAASGAMQPKHSPSDIVVIDLTDDDVTDANDSLAVDEYLVVGPFALSASEGEPMFKGFQVHVPNGVLASGDSVDISYQILPGRSITDTITAMWTVVAVMLMVSTRLPLILSSITIAPKGIGLG